MYNGINDNILRINSSSPEATRLGIAARVKARRLEMNLTQKGMASRAGMPTATYRRFEALGEISLSNLILIAGVLGMTEDLEKIFSEKKYMDIEEVINTNKQRERKRGREND